MMHSASLSISASTAVRMLRRAEEEIHANEDLLTRLDSATGDGDHGTTMSRAWEGVGRALRESPPATAAGAFQCAAEVFLALDGGATGPLFGTFFSGVAAGWESGFADAFRGGTAELQRCSGAKAGDKTMLDAILPAADALEAAAPSGLAEAMRAAANAARAGAESTKEMRARAGRARFRGALSLGHQDAGATSVVFIFEGFAAALEEQRSA